MRIKAHVLWAVLAAIAIAFYLKFESIELFGLVIGAMLPDIIEPPRNAWHRRFFHSKRMFKIIILLAIAAFALSFADKKWLWVLFTLVGYEIHLIGDALFHKLPR